MLQPLEVPRWPAAPASPWWCEIRSGGRAAGPWPSARAGRQTGPSPGGRPAPAAWPPRTGDRGQEHVAVLQPLKALCRPATRRYEGRLREVAAAELQPLEEQSC